MVCEELWEVLVLVLFLWVDMVIKVVLLFDFVYCEWFWLFVDELLMFQKFDILKLVLINIWKYGLCCVLGVQDFLQVYEIYGYDLVKIIIFGCQMKLLLCVMDGVVVKFMLELMGQVEVDEKDEMFSYGISLLCDGVSVFVK